MTDLHYFSKPTETSPGTFNPVFEILDHPVATGDADAVVITGPAPEKPVLDGREVSDPRLVRALSTPVEITRAEALDRSAKLGGVLRALGIAADAADDTSDDGPSSEDSVRTQDPAEEHATGDARLLIDEGVSPIARALSVLAAVRVGLLVDVRSPHTRGTGTDAVVTTPAGPAAAEVVSEAGLIDAEPLEAGPIVLIHPIDAAPVDPGRASVKVVRSRFEGVGITIAGETANLDQAMRDSRVESAQVRPLSPETPVILDDSGAVDARSSLDWLRREILTD
ncbi:hypothetical protein DFO66_101123 [Brevibacterium sanguinis]|uniref:Uncharacterized protein n=2 Tax=Brevibacterium TaxID=1696 RepID=A0A366IQQ5_9MICO|nr:MULTISPECIES: hypothetical protein [Brevibacterium]RBP67902.1 hypothetical protein DFO66_101123 [Brevibacterium sanguinis]RBP74681.1 hypothetical protein DFO65_101406 [Brevibacterium celere]